MPDDTPQPAPPRRQPIGLPQAMVLVAVAAGVAIALTAKPHQSPPTQSALDAARAAAEAEQAAAAVDPEAGKEFWRSSNATVWSHRSQDYGMGGTIKTACVDSGVQVLLSPPYQSHQPTLCVRRHPEHGQDVMVSLPLGGQFLCASYDGCIVRVRFDDAPPESFSAVEPADLDSATLFIVNDRRFVAGLTKARRVRIEATLYRNGSQVMDFYVAGFDPARLTSEPAD